MKKLSYSTFILAAGLLLSSCSTEEFAADTAIDSGDVYQRRTNALLAMDFTTLFSYTDIEEAKSGLTSALSNIAGQSRRMLQIPVYKSSTDAVYKIIIREGKAKIWAKHILDMNSRKLIHSSSKPEGTHNMHVLPREQHQAVYEQVADVLTNNSNSIGNYDNTLTISALNTYIDKKLSTASGSAELYLKVNNDSVEIYALQ